MVLSNKKLKQKLRASVTDSVTESVSNQKASAYSNLTELIDSATHKPRLSKREKRRSSLPLLNPLAVGVEKDNEEASADKGLKHKKRKRNDGGVPDNVEGSRKSKKKKKKKKGKKKKSEVEENGFEHRSEQSEAATASLAERHCYKSVCFGGIPYYSTEDDIRSNFESCGSIIEVFCMTFPDTGKFRGIAIIGFKTEAAAKRALGFDGTDMGGLLLKVKPYKMPETTIHKTSNFAPQMLKGYNRIYIGNLSWDVTEDDLRDLFSDCSISSIRFGTDKETGEFRGYAHVDFSDSLSLTMALKLDQQLVCGRPAKISYAVPPKTALKPETEPKPEPAMMQDPKDTSATDSGTEKKKIRRNCYLCGEKGHLLPHVCKHKTKMRNNLNPAPKIILSAFLVQRAAIQCHVISSLQSLTTHISWLSSLGCGSDQTLGHLLGDDRIRD